MEPPWGLPGGSRSLCGVSWCLPGTLLGSLYAPCESPGTPRDLPGASLRSPGFSPATPLGLPGLPGDSRDSPGTFPGLPRDSPGFPWTPRGLLGLPGVLGATPVWTHADTYPPQTPAHTYTTRHFVSCMLSAVGLQRQSVFHEDVVSSQNRAGKLGMGNGWSPICSGSFPLKGEHTDVEFPIRLKRNNP